MTFSLAPTTYPCLAAQALAWMFRPPKATRRNKRANFPYRHCEREPKQSRGRSALCPPGLLRRFAPRNDGCRAPGAIQGISAPRLNPYMGVDLTAKHEPFAKLGNQCEMCL